MLARSIVVDVARSACGIEHDGMTYNPNSPFTTNDNTSKAETYGLGDFGRWCRVVVGRIRSDARQGQTPLGNPSRHCCASASPISSSA